MQEQTEQTPMSWNSDGAADPEAERILEILSRINAELEEIADKVDEIGRIN